VQTAARACAWVYVCVSACVNGRVAPLLLPVRSCGCPSSYLKVKAEELTYREVWCVAVRAEGGRGVVGEEGQTLSFTQVA
jgi:hypothetical protein